MKTIKVLSLGAGVQSSTLLLMSCKGVLPKLDAAIFSNTGWETKEVYANLSQLIIDAAKAQIPLYIVENGNIKEDALINQVRGTKQKGSRWASMPYFTKGGDGRIGKIRRQCTKEYKIVPVERKIRQLLGYKPRQRIAPGSVEQWMGISTDEARRARISDRRWVDFHYPLILDKRMSRQDCLRWLGKNYPGRNFPRSSCVGCPFHSNTEWRRMKNEDTASWADAVLFDKSIRNMGGMRGQVYLHRDCVPLCEVDLTTLEDNGQINWLDECAGVCGI